MSWADTWPWNAPASTDWAIAYGLAGAIAIYGAHHLGGAVAAALDRRRRAAPTPEVGAYRAQPARQLEPGQLPTLDELWLIAFAQQGPVRLAETLVAETFATRWLRPSRTPLAYEVAPDASREDPLLAVFFALLAGTKELSPRQIHDAAVIAGRDHRKTAWQRLELAGLLRSRAASVTEALVVTITLVLALGCGLLRLLALGEVAAGPFPGALAIAMVFLAVIAAVHVWVAVAHHGGVGARGVAYLRWLEAHLGSQEVSAAPSRAPSSLGLAVAVRGLQAARGDHDLAPLLVPFGPSRTLPFGGGGDDDD